MAANGKTAKEPLTLEQIFHLTWSIGDGNKWWERMVFTHDYDQRVTSFSAIEGHLIDMRELALEWLTLLHEQLETVDGSHNISSSSIGKHSGHMHLARDNATVTEMLKQFQHLQGSILEYLVPFVSRGITSSVRCAALRCLRSIVEFGIPLTLVYSDTTLINTIICECLAHEQDEHVSICALLLLQAIFTSHSRTKFNNVILHFISQLNQYAVAIAQKGNRYGTISDGSVMGHILKLMIAIGNNHTDLLLHGGEPGIAMLHFILEHCIRIDQNTFWNADDESLNHIIESRRQLSESAVDLWGAIAENLETMQSVERMRAVPLFEDLLRSTVYLCVSIDDDENDEEHRRHVIEEIVLAAYLVLFDRFFIVCGNMMDHFMSHCADPRTPAYGRALCAIEAVLFVMTNVGSNVTYQNHYRQDDTEQLIEFPFIDRIAATVANLDSQLFGSDDSVSRWLFRIQRLKLRCVDVLGNYAFLMAKDYERLISKDITRAIDIISWNLKFSISAYLQWFLHDQNIQDLSPCSRCCRSFRLLCQHLFGVSQLSKCANLTAMSELAASIAKSFVDTFYRDDVTQRTLFLLSQIGHDGPSSLFDSFANSQHELYCGISHLLRFIFEIQNNRAADTIQLVLLPTVQEIQYLQQQQQQQIIDTQCRRSQLCFIKFSGLVNAFRLSENPTGTVLKCTILHDLFSSLWIPMFESSIQRFIGSYADCSNKQELILEHICLAIQEMILCIPRELQSSSPLFQMITTTATTLFVRRVPSPHLLALISSLVPLPTEVNVQESRVIQILLCGPMQQSFGHWHICEKLLCLAVQNRVTSDLLDCFFQYLYTLVHKQQFAVFFFNIDPHNDTHTCEQMKTMLEQLMLFAVQCVDLPEASTCQHVVAFLDSFLQAQISENIRYAEIRTQLVMEISPSLINTLWKGILLEHSLNTHHLIKLIFRYSVSFNKILQAYTMNFVVGNDTIKKSNISNTEKQHFVAMLARSRTMGSVRQVVSHFKQQVSMQ